MLMDDKDCTLWNRTLIEEGPTMVDKAIRYCCIGMHRTQLAIAVLHAHAVRPKDTNLAKIDPALFGAEGNQ